MAEKLAQKEALGKEITEGLRKEGMILTWYKDKPEGWLLRSGIWSPIYINLRDLPSAPLLYQKVGNAMSMLVREAGFKADGRHRLVGVAMAGIPFANAITLETGIPSLYTRKLPDDIVTREEIKGWLAHHGQHSLVEGKLKSGDRLAVVDDLVTGFDSKELATNQIRFEAERRGINIEITDVIVLVDRENRIKGVSASERAAQLGLRLHSLIPFTSKGLGWLRESFAEIEYSTILDYQKDPEKYRDPELRERLIGLARKN